MKIREKASVAVALSFAFLAAPQSAYAHSYDTCYEQVATACFNAGGTVQDCASKANAQCRNHKHSGGGSVDPASQDFAAPSRPSLGRGKNNGLKTPTAPRRQRLQQK